ncbi:hypothetical protein ACE6ED_02005 [Paenibacillus sp. CN-4]|uniref:hypothetical protein n=1 Tax=Paenibacillus nanchangensis TaxID=3348343 RepID=UPI00397AB29C
MKLFIEHILDEIEQIGLGRGLRSSLSANQNDDNYVRGVLQWFDDSYDIHYVILFSYPEEHPCLNYVFWVLDREGNQTVIEQDGSKEKMMDIVKEKALREINVNLAKGEEIRQLFAVLERLPVRPDVQKEFS